MVEGRLNLELGIEGSRAGTTRAEHSREVAKGRPWGSRGCTRPSAWRIWMSRLQGSSSASVGGAGDGRDPTTLKPLWGRRDARRAGFTGRVRTSASRTGALASALFLVAAATLLAATPPAPALTSSSIGFDRVTLSWPAISATPQIQKFQVRYSSTNLLAAVWMDIPGSDHNTTSHTVTGLTGNTGYVFQVRAVNADGNGATALKSATTLDPAFHRPAGFTATGASASSTCRGRRRSRKSPYTGTSTG